MPTPSASPAKIIKIAKAEVGYHEGRSDGHWNNHQKYSPAVPGLEWSQNQAWCATFVAWCAMKAGFSALYPKTASCDVAGKFFKDRKRWSEYPAIGAQIFFGTPSDLNHTGIVTNYDATYVYTIEGNTNDSGSREGDGVYVKRHVRTSSRIVGYGYPKFAEGIQSADPAYKAQAPKPAAPAPTPAPVAKKAVRIQHSSLQFSDTPAQQRSDITKIFGLGNDVVTWTEASPDNANHRLVKEIGPKFGYHVYCPGSGVGVAVKKSFGKVVLSNFKLVAKGKAHQYSNRGVAYSTVRTASGEVITFGAVHYLTKGRTVADGARYLINKSFAAMIGRIAKDKAAGRRLVFISGDFNILDNKQDVFFGEPLTTCWDELKKWPSTGHGNIDAIASYDGDTRVKCEGARAYNDAAFPLHTDHFTIKATYSIR